MRTAWGPLHLLLFGEPLADHGVDRGLYESRGNSLAGSIPLAVIDEAGCIRGDIDAELASGGDKSAQIRIVRFKTEEVAFKVLDHVLSLGRVAMP